MDFIGKIIGLCVGLAVAVVLIVNLLLPTINGALEGLDATSAAMLKAIGTIALIVPIAFVARAIGSAGRD